MSILTSFGSAPRAQIAQFFSLIFVLSFSQLTKANATPQRNEEVIASVECSVKDPGDLKAYLGINKGSLIRIETLSSYVSSVILDRDDLITGFPAVLNFDTRRNIFSFSGSSEDSSAASRVTLNIEGTLSEPGEANFIFNLVDREVDASGVARLSGCKRVE